MPGVERPPDSPEPLPGGPQSPGPQSPLPGGQSPGPGGPPPGWPQSPPPGPEAGPPPFPSDWQQPAGPQQQAYAGAQLAGWGVRLGAYLIDGLVLVIPAILLFVALVAGAVGIGSGNEDVTAGAVIGALFLWFLLMTVIYLLYAPLLMARSGDRNGQTWGKQLLSIRVVRDGGVPFNYGSAALREVVLKFLAVGIAASIIPIIPWFLNFFWPLWDDQNRALHDMVVSTHVVKA